MTRPNISKAIRTLHLAFKGNTTAEIYDILMEQLLRAIKKYDPAYTEKVKLVAKAIHATRQQQFTAARLNDRLEFDSDRYIRMLGRRGFLQAVFGERKKVLGWRRTENWPPPKSFFESNPIGLAYCVQTWFRYYLQEYTLRRNDFFR